MEFWKKWSFVFFLLICGVGILTITDSWQGAIRPARGMRTWMLAAGANAEQFLSGIPGFGEPEEVFADGLRNNIERYSTEGGSVLPEEDGKENSLGGKAEGITDQQGQILSCETPHAVEEDLISGSSEVVERQEPEVTYRDPLEIVYTTVEDDYFSDAVFIGDSRTVGMFEYGGLENTATFYASTGLTIFKLFDSAIVPVPDSKEKITIEQALNERQFGKIYLMVGINEMGRGDLEGFLTKYSEVIAHLQELQPNAIIYLQGIMKVTTERSNQGDYISNAGIEERNHGIAGLADNVKIYYLDVNPIICDETGGMEPSYTTDGVHLMAQYIPMWKDFLKQHAVMLD